MRCSYTNYRRETVLARYKRTDSPTPTSLAATGGERARTERHYIMCTSEETYKKIFESDKIEDLTKKIFSDKPVAHLPYKKLDIAIGGVKNRIYLITAAPGTGKTTMLMNIACDFAMNNQPVLYCNLEMPHVELTKKGIILTSENRLCTAQMAEADKNKELIEKEIERYSQSVSPNMAFSDKPLSAEDIEDYSNGIKQETGRAPIVFVDYCQLLRAPKEMTDERLALAHTMEIFRSITTQIGSPLFVISALKRGCYSKPSVDLDTLSGSQSIEYGSDVVLTLTKPPKDWEAKQQLEYGETGIIATLLKNRYGINGSKVNFAFNPTFAQFREI